MALLRTNVWPAGHWSERWERSFLTKTKKKKRSTLQYHQFALGRDTSKTLGRNDTTTEQVTILVEDRDMGSTERWCILDLLV